jgi:cation diffusion facilitator CzcD-associated flavoprotein CzcO
VQIISAIVGRVGKVSLFQRTAQWIMPIPNPAYTEVQRKEFGQDTAALRQLYDGLSEIFDAFSDGVVDADSEAMHRIEEACLANLEDHVTDPDLRECLRPSYRAACKRLIVSPDFYDAIRRPNAELVTSHIERVERGGVRTADGRLHELDVLVLATGFKVDAFMRPVRIQGRGGRDLDRAWSPRPEAYLSISVPEFPNLFMLNGPNGPVGNFSLIQVAELQMNYILQLVQELRSGRTEVSPTPEALAQFEADRLDASRNTIWSTGCRSWYLDDRGVPMVWPWPFSRFREAMAKPELAAYDLR